jgi:hypothetical protein
LVLDHVSLNVRPRDTLSGWVDHWLDHLLVYPGVT